MTGTALAELRRIQATFTVVQSRTYHERVASWTRALTQVLPDEAMLYLAQCIQQRTHPDGRRLRSLAEQFTRPEPPRVA